jgi:hypothetical protein
LTGSWPAVVEVRGVDGAAGAAEVRCVDAGLALRVCGVLVIEGGRAGWDGIGGGLYTGRDPLVAGRFWDAGGTGPCRGIGVTANDG